MRSIYVPVHVVVLLRRLANAFSTFSISHQYLQGRDELSRRGETASPVSRALGVAEWPWWTHRDTWRWPITDMIDNPRVREANQVYALPYPSIGRRWSLPSLLSLSTELTSNESSSTPPLRRLSPDHDPPASKHRPKPQSPFPEQPDKLDTIHTLLKNPALYDPLRTPRYPLVLCHGLYGFDSRGPSTFPSLRMHYWANVLNILRKKIGAEVIVTSVPGTGSIESRSEILHERLKQRAHGRGVNFLAHSMGGLDCRHLITHIQPTDYVPLSLTSVATPHRGSPFMDWCGDYIGLGKINQNSKFARSAATQPSESPPEGSPATSSTAAFLAQTLMSLPSSVTTLILSMVDSPAYANLTTHYLNEVFNPCTPNDPRVKYFSVAARMTGVNVLHPFWLPKMVLDGWEEKQRAKERIYWEGHLQGIDPPGQIPRWASEQEWGNDGLVTVQSAKWGEFLGTMEGCDHWQIRGARGIEFGVDLPAIPAIGLGGPTHSPSESKRTDNGGWLPEWSKFMGAWRTQEKKFHEEASRSDSSFAFSGTVNVDSSAPGDTASATKTKTAPASASTSSHHQHEGGIGPEDDAVVRSATAKLSAVLDWVMQVPVGVASSASESPTPKATSMSIPSSSKQTQTRQVGGISAETQKRIASELATKEDLERFYVALSRKLYDEGL